MAEMSRFGRWMVNRRNVARSKRLLDTVGPFLVVPTSSRLLEIGSGAGGLSGLLWERYRPDRVVATDFDPSQIEAARRSLTARYGAVPPNLELRTADALRLPFDDASFDAVFAINVFHHVEARHSDFVRRPEAAREVRRVLRPGGILVYAEISRCEEFRECLRELGFAPLFLRTRWGHDLAVVRSPTPLEVARQRE